ncbi:MAG: hypothetical protein ABEJ83_03740 [Candidatus Nanohaloarchaea archaeon]
MKERLKYYLRKAINEPELIVPFLKTKYRLTKAKLKDKAVRVNTDFQKNLLNEVRRSDSYLIIILDACRYDFFEETYQEYLDGELRQVYSTGRNTFEYARNAWGGEHDTTYVSGAVPINSQDIQDEDFKEMHDDYKAQNHIGNIVDAWKDAWSEDKGTVLPDKVTKAAIQNYSDKMVVHYYQPHAPFIGDKEMISRIEEDREYLNGNPMDKDVWERIKSEEVTTEELHQLYKDNLRRVLEEVQRLVEFSDHDRVIVTSDHGELLGEGGFYAHPTIDHPLLRKVPWLEIE